jgi:hypothetical protein
MCVCASHCCVHVCSALGGGPRTSEGAALALTIRPWHRAHCTTALARAATAASAASVAAMFWRELRLARWAVARLCLCACACACQGKGEAATCCRTGRWWWWRCRRRRTFRPSVCVRVRRTALYVPAVHRHTYTHTQPWEMGCCRWSAAAWPRCSTRRSSMFASCATFSAATPRYRPAPLSTAKRTQRQRERERERESGIEENTHTERERRTRKQAQTQTDRHAYTAPHCPSLRRA